MREFINAGGVVILDYRLSHSPSKTPKKAELGMPGNPNLQHSLSSIDPRCPLQDAWPYLRKTMWRYEGKGGDAFCFLWNICMDERW